jgi:hypothetical protein
MKADARQAIRDRGQDPTESVRSDELPAGTFEKVAFDKAVRDRLAEFGVDPATAAPALYEAVETLIRSENAAGGERA